jgi:membrane protease YdiL (CAAX protease family)
MLKGAYHDINSFSKFILLIILVFSFLLFSLLFGILALVPFYGTGVISFLTTPNYSDPSAVAALKVLQIFNMAGGLLLPAVIYLWLCSPEGKTFVSYSKSTNYLPIVLSALLIVCAQPLIGWTSELNSYLSLPEGLSFIENWMKNAEIQGELITEAFLSTTSTGGLLVNVFMIAILPAFAEEILFRGVLASLFKDWTKNIHVAVFLSAFIFAAIHLQFYGFLTRFLLGTALGYLFFWSGSLWLPIVAHFTNNFLSVIVEFLFRKGTIQTNADNFGVDNTIWLTALSFVGVTGILFYIYNLTVKHTDKG